MLVDACRVYFCPVNRAHNASCGLARESAHNFCQRRLPRPVLPVIAIDCRSDQREATFSKMMRRLRLWKVIRRIMKFFSCAMTYVPRKLITSFLIFKRRLSKVLLSTDKMKCHEIFRRIRIDNIKVPSSFKISELKHCILWKV